MTAENGDAQHAALASRTRRDVLELIAASAQPLGASEIAEHINLHITTVRFHLDQLENAHLIRREIEREGRRGRPRVVYRGSSAAHQSTVHRQLIEVLAGALAADADGGRARAVHAGVQWADTLLSAHATPPTGNGIEPLMNVLGEVGFEPELDMAHDDRVIQLMACPFREAALDHPSVVCSVHRGLIQGTLGKMGHDTGEASLHPFVQPELCTVTLRGALA
jgi:Predicted transcriptional regulator